MLVPGCRGRAADDVEDVGEQSGVRGLVPRQRFQQFPGAGDQEGQDGPVRLGEGQRAFGGLVRRALVTEFTLGEPGYQVSLHDREVADDGRDAVQDVPQRAEGRGRIAFGEADRGAGVTDFARADARSRAARRSTRSISRGLLGPPSRACLGIYADTLTKHGDQHPCPPGFGRA